MTDPSPRTAATARDALALAMHQWGIDCSRFAGSAMVSPSGASPLGRVVLTCNPGYHIHNAEHIIEALPDGWTLALTAAEAPGRVAALETALDELMTLRTEHGLNCYVTEEAGCVCGLDQALERITDVRLAAPAPPAGVSVGRCENCTHVEQATTAALLAHPIHPPLARLIQRALESYSGKTWAEYSRLSAREAAEAIAGRLFPSYDQGKKLPADRVLRELRGDVVEPLSDEVAP